MSYNAHISILKESSTARVIRVFPEFPIVRYLPGQYGSLGLLSMQETPAGTKKLIKRPYSLSCSMVDLASSSLLDPYDHTYYEFYFNRLPSSLVVGEHLTPLLFELKDGDPIFCGPKVVGYYTLKGVTSEKDILLIGSSTGESPNNSIVNQALFDRWNGKICQVNIGPNGWTGLYEEEQKFLTESYPSYRYISQRAEGYSAIEELVRNCLSDSDYSLSTLGFVLNAASSHVFICGDPTLIGAPKKLGGWRYETPDFGVLRILDAAGFVVKTKFQEGNLEFETYW